MLGRAKRANGEKVTIWQRLYRLLALIIIVVLSLLLILVLAGSHLEPVFEFLGLRRVISDKKGLYADCSKPENATNSFCIRDPEKKELEWRSISKGGSAFSLTEK